MKQCPKCKIVWDGETFSRKGFKPTCQKCGYILEGNKNKM